MPFGFFGKEFIMMFDVSINTTMLFILPAKAIDLAYNGEFCIGLQPSINYAKHKESFSCVTPAITV